MTRTALLAATASFLFAGTPAFADGKDDKKLTGLGEVGWDTTGYDLDWTTNDLDTNMFHGADDLSLNGEAEYLIPDCTTSIYAGLGYGTIDWDNADIDYWRFGLGLRVHFGTAGSLIQRNRVEPLPALGRLPFAL